MRILSYSSIFWCCSILFTRSLDVQDNANFQDNGLKGADIENLPNLPNNAVSANTLNKSPPQEDDRGQTQAATNFEIKAVLTKCQTQRTCDCDETSHDCFSKESRMNPLRTNSERSRCEMEADEELLTRCDKKLSLTLKIKNRGITNCKPQYVILDHVFDPMTEKKQKLLNPYVLKITQSPVLQTYDLIFENVVNSKASEKVVNKDDEGFSGCSTDPNNPTCKGFQYNNQEVPYSTGFCCSCDQDKQNANLSNNAEAKYSREANKLGLPEYNKNDYEYDALKGKDGNFKDAEAAINSQNMMPDNIGYSPRFDRQLMPENAGDHDLHNVQKRGGQNCEYTPPNADQSYHDSAHCLEFSEIWYGIYSFSHPDIQHSLEIQIYEKIGTKGGRILWQEITRGVPLFLGTFRERHVSHDRSILAYYTINKNTDNEFSIDCKSRKLLIPETSGKEVDKSQFPELQGGPEEYLVVKDSEIDLSGKSCNKAGVGYEAFYRQPRKCDVGKDSCLQNQPKHFWEHDHEKEASGQKGCYFLKYYGCLPQDPVRSKPCNGSESPSQNKVLHMYFTQCLTSIVNINFVADLNAVLRPNALAIITEVYTETLNPKKITVTAKVFNSGLVTSIFYIGISGCPMKVPASFSSISSQPVLIAPQYQHVFTLEIYCEVPMRKFFCSLEVMNLNQELIAIRRIRFKRYDRCICVWHCECTCLLADYGLKCTPMEIKHYHAAGFQGGMAVPAQVVNYSAFDDTLAIILHIILYCCLTLWYMGLLKALFGCCLPPIGLWGLDKILDLPRKLSRYFEMELKDEEVIYDEAGWPIHPETKKRVHIISPAAQFCTNVVFFFVFPFAIIWNLVKKLLAPKSPDALYSDLDICQCKASQISLLRNSSLQNSAKTKSKTKYTNDEKKSNSKCCLKKKR